LILPVSHLQTQQLMTSQIRPHRTFNTTLSNKVLVCILYSKLINSLISLTVFNMI